MIAKRVPRDTFRRLSASARLLPDFLIIGAQKCGTTSLYKYLIQHPDVAPFVPVGHRRQEIRFFTRYFGNGERWYRAHFPTKLYRSTLRLALQRRLLTGESTPSYLFDPRAPRRIRSLLPQARLIVLLRNPIDRAYSQYQHVVRLGKEPLSFEQAIEEEGNRLRGELEKMMVDEDYVSFERGYHSYVARGMYADQLDKVFEFFPKEQVLVLNAEVFFSHPAEVFALVVRFLGLRDWDLTDYAEHNAGSYANMLPATREQLAGQFAPHNQRLYELIGETYRWR